MNGGLKIGSIYILKNATNNIFDIFKRFFLNKDHHLVQNELIKKTSILKPFNRSLKYLTSYNTSYHGGCNIICTYCSTFTLCNSPKGC